VPANWLQWLLPGQKSAEHTETRALLSRVHANSKRSPFRNADTRAEFIVDIIFEACESYGGVPGTPLGEALYQTIERLLAFDSFTLALPSESDLESLTVDEGVRLRATLRAHERFLSAHERLIPIWRDKLVWLFSGMLGYVPTSAFIDVREDGAPDEDSIVLPEARLYDLCDNLPEVIERLIATFFDTDITEADLFSPMRERLEHNLLVASGIEPGTRDVSVSRVVMPTKSRLTDASAIVDVYLAGTPFQALLYAQLPFAIPFPARFEHTHIVGGTGHGKTQLMQFLIHHDLVRAAEDGRSVVVLDSQGDLIKAVSQLALWSPEVSGSLSDRLVIVDPNDIEYPVCLNMFDFDRDRLSGYAPVDREKILNATIELYEYFFGALLGAELTQRQGLIFKYLARLLIEIPDATIHTLRELMEDGEKFRPHMERLSGTARSFFATRFFDRQFNETKKQVLTRLWGVLSNGSLERMFSHSRNKVDVFSLLNDGKIILINTAKDLLGQEGSAIFGRFFIALIAQAAVQRAAMPAHTRRPAFVYIDEAQDYFDQNISHLLNQARKYRVGLIFAHQNLDQLGAGLRASVLASTTIKFAGGLSAKDAHALDSEFRTSAEYLLGQAKHRMHTEFACFVKSYTPKALSVSVPLGFLESQPRISARAYSSLIDENRARYSEPPLIPADIPFDRPQSPRDEAPKQRRSRASQDSERANTEVIQQPAPSSPPLERFQEAVHVEEESQSRAQPAPRRSASSPEREPGRGGRQHKYLQQLVKKLGEERGFRATIEETILDGAGRVDVSLVRDNLQIAFQVSVTTTKDWELGGIEKCLAAGFGEVVLVCSSERQVKQISQFVTENVDESQAGKITFVSPETIVEYFERHGVQSTKDTVVRGYKVRTTQKPIDPDDAVARRKAVSEVIARSMRKKD